MSASLKRLEDAEVQYQAVREKWANYVRAAGMHDIAAEPISSRYQLEVLGWSFLVTFHWSPRTNSGYIRYFFVQNKGWPEEKFIQTAIYRLDTLGNVREVESNFGQIEVGNVPEVKNFHANRIVDALSKFPIVGDPQQH